MNVINGLANVLQNNLKARDGSPAKETLQREEIRNFAVTMKHNAIQLHHMTLMLYDSSDTGLADTSRYERKDKVLCNELVHTCITDILSRGAVQEIHFETQLPDDLCITTNRLFLTRTINELLQNATKYSDGQHITVSASRTENAVRFIIEDVGPGLPKYSEDLLFVPFTKVDDLSVGLGLGLPLCKRHMTGLGGNIIHDTTYERGCRFIIELPLS